ncbi:hypothetical protein [Caballeronia grimmiae]|uniref:hypothetical protein n=1 Tax=Caballeronia grimmiae TaxID=1071679 RepID=UPI0038B88451
MSESDVDAPLVEWLNASRKAGVVNSVCAAPAAAVERLKPHLHGDWVFSDCHNAPTSQRSAATVVATEAGGARRLCGIGDGVSRQVQRPAAITPSALSATVGAIIGDYLTAYGHELGDGLFALREWNEALQSVASTIHCLCAQTLLDSHVRGAVVELRRHLTSGGGL